MKIISNEEIDYQIKYTLEHNPHIPVEVLLKPMVESACKKQLEADQKQELTPLEAKHILRTLHQHYDKAGWCVCCESAEAKLKLIAREK